MDPKLPQPPASPPKQKHDNPYIHNVALVVTPIAMGAMFLPPRHFDMRMIVLGGCSLWGINQLRSDWTGKTFLERMPSLPDMAGGELPEKAKETQARIREEKSRREQARMGLNEKEAQLLEEQRQKKEKENRGALEAIWMGDSKDDWKEKREQREKEAFKEGGKGVWGLISEQVSEVWSSKKTTDEPPKNDTPRKDS